MNCTGKTTKKLVLYPLKYEGDEKNHKEGNELRCSGPVVRLKEIFIFQYIKRLSLTGTVLVIAIQVSAAVETARESLYV